MLSTLVAVSCSSLLSISVMLANSTAVAFISFLLPCLCLKESHIHKSATTEFIPPSERVNDILKITGTKWPCLYTCVGVLVWQQLHVDIIYRQRLGPYLNQIRSTTMLTAASTNTITNTATPASRPGSRDSSSAFVQMVYNIFLGWITALYMNRIFTWAFRTHVHCTCSQNIFESYRYWITTYSFGLCPELSCKIWLVV